MNLEILDTLPYFLENWYNRVEKDGDRTLIVDGCGDRKFTASQMEQASGKIYAWLKKQGIGANDFVMINMPRGGEAVICMLGVWKAGAALTIVEDDYAPDRIAYIRENVGCRLTLDQETYRAIQAGETYERGYREAANHDASFAIYTSGTTGFPKGIVHEYGNIKLNTLSAKGKVEGRVSRDSRYSFLSPLNFIASVKIVLSLIQGGFTAYIIPYEIGKNPLKLMRYFEEHEISVTFLSPSILRIVGNRLPSCVKVVYTGSEPANGIAPNGVRLINSYSMSEGAFTLAQFEIDRAYDVCPIGKPNDGGIQLRIVDEEGRDLPDGEMGEIVFENPFMRGYIGLPAETAAVLKDGVYHTGDLGRRLPDGNLILLGRAGEMIKINGNRIEPAEIERAFKEATGKEICCAKGFEEGGHAFLCVYYTGEPLADEQAVREKLRETLPYYMIPSWLIPLEEMPLLPNGKINKRALRPPEEDAAAVPYEAPADELEKRMCDAAARILHRDQVGVRDDFYQMGGDSLKAMAMLAELNLDDLTATDIFNGCTVRGIADLYRARLERNNGFSKEEYEMEARRTAFPPFACQTSLIDIQLNGPKHPAFNIPVCFSFEDVSIADRLCEAMNKVVQHSPVFSTVFGFDEDCHFVERYVPGLFGTVRMERATEADIPRITKKYMAHFPKLFGVPLCRAGIVVTEARGYLLMNFHHAVIDGMGTQVLIQRLMAAYRGEPLPMDTFYSSLRRSVEHEREPAYQEAKTYMESTYGSTAFSRNFDPDREEGSPTQAIHPIPLALKPRDMEDFEKRTGFTRNQLCCAALLTAMAKCNHCPDVIMSSAFHNRVDQVSKNALGPQLRKVPTALRMGEVKNAAEMLRSIQTQSVNAIRHCAYEYVIQTEEPFCTDYISMAYETSEIMGGGSKGGIGLKPYPCAADDPYAPIRMFFMIAEQAESLNFLLIHSARFYSEGRVQECGQAIADAMTALLRAERLEELTTGELLA